MQKVSKLNRISELAATDRGFLLDLRIGTVAAFLFNPMEGL